MSAGAPTRYPDPDYEDFGAIDITTLIEQVRINVPDGTVTVRGTVTEIQAYPVYVYGTLRDLDGQTKMKFRCATAVAPSLHDAVVLRGTLVPTGSKKLLGFDLQLRGSVVGRWTPHAPTGVASVQLKREPKVPLERFLSEGPVKRLILIGTGKAEGDTKTTLSRDPRQPAESKDVKTGLSTLLDAIKDVSHKYDGICLIRGGSDPDSFKTWNDVRLIDALIGCGMHFYTAVGHSDDYTLADKYADESFANPSDFASACNEAWKARDRREKQERELRSAWQKVRALEEEKINTERSKLDRNLTLLQNAVEELRKLPATLSRQLAQPARIEGLASLQADLSRTVSAAVQEPIDDLKQSINGAQTVMLGVPQRTRFHRWTVLLVIFLSGVVLGGLGCLIVVSKVPDVLNRVQTAQPQTATLPPPAPAQAGGRHKLRPSGQAN